MSDLQFLIDKKQGGAIANTKGADDLTVKRQHVYRVTVRPENGTISTKETTAGSLRLAIESYGEHLELLGVERIDPLTGELVVFAIR